MTDDALEQQPGGAAADPQPDAAPHADAPAGPSQVPDATSPETLTGELDRCRDRLLRTAAEFENYRRRTERERRELTDRTVENLLLELVGIVDDFERALSADPGSGAEAYRQGVELIYRRVLELLGRRGVTPIDAVGAIFDPNIHQAVTAEPAGERRDGEVVEQFRRGYMIGDRLLRPAMVKVARA